MPAPESIRQLVERFEQHRDAYRAGKYNETQLRREFLDPFFEALDWDVFNKLGYSEDNKHVIHEDSLEIEGAKKAPDYAFKVGKERKFFVEAKKPSVKIETNPEVAFQLKRYVWSAKLPLGILTDFEEFAVYECRSKPQVSDSVKTGRVMLLNYTDYIEKWDEIAAIFSHDAVMQGGFDKFANSTAKKKGTAEVDDAFLDEIEGWRETLAKNIALRNKLRIKSEADLNYAVQMTIDRIIFLRICEDRGYEAEYQLQELSKRENIYAELNKLFVKADIKYNSGLFHFKEEKGRGRADTFTTGLDVDDKVLKDIIKDLYYPSPYIFSLIPDDILGQIYEQFLGKVIRLTAGGNAKVEEKPEVRKAGGVYYTPTFIVDTIVINTLGKLLLGLTPKEAARLKILDPACGSGTFLLGAYQYLLDWYLKWYTENNPEKWAKGKEAAIYKSKDGWKLTVNKKKEILLNNIYGVDIDPQAVEVTKLSLLLKVIEDPGQLSYLDERILPDLGKNIQCGNSLIGLDYWEGQLMVDEEERARVNAFDWKAAFPEVFAQGGFDAVIGNPPYIRIQAMREWASDQVEYYAKKYKAASKGNYDIYVVFVEKALSLLNSRGRLGLILPSKFFATDYGESIRELIAEKKSLSRIADFGHLQIFEQATTYTCLLFLAGSPQTSFDYARVNSPDDLQNAGFRTIQNSLSSQPWVFSDENTQKLAEKINSVSKPLSGLPTRIGRGSSSGADDVFMLRKEGNNLFTRQGDKIEIESNILRQPIYATDFGRFVFRPAQEEVIIFPYEVKSNGYELFAEKKIKNQYPKAYEYLQSRKKELLERKQFKEWYGFSAPRNLDVHETAQILVPLLANRGLYCRLSDDSSRYCLMASGGFSITVSNENRLSPNYVLGLLNSALLFWRLSSISNVFRGGWITCTKQYVETLPIRSINFSDPTEKAQHDKMVSLVERMLALHKSLASAHNPQEADRLTREVESVDKSIDGLVYELYGLSEDEIRIVDGT